MKFRSNYILESFCSLKEAFLFKIASIKYSRLHCHILCIGYIVLQLTQNFPNQPLMLLGL